MEREMDRITVNGIEYVRAQPAVAPAIATPAAAKRVPQPKMVERKCRRCRAKFLARASDVKRGWGLYCSKSCKAIRQEARHGYYQAHQERRDGHEGGEFTDAHLFSNEEHDCNKD